MLKVGEFILKVVFATTPADVGFLAAEKAKRTPVVGSFLTAMGTITFERPQDLKKKLVGTITVKEGEETTIIGTGSSFTKDFKVGDLIHFPNTEVIFLFTLTFKETRFSC